MVRSALACALLILAGVSGVAGQAGRTAVYTAEQAARGKVSERDNAMAAGKGFGACSDCHGEGLTGRVGDPDERPAVASLKPGVQAEIAKNGGRIPDLAGSNIPGTLRQIAPSKDLTVKRSQGSFSRALEEMRLDILAYHPVQRTAIAPGVNL